MKLLPGYYNLGQPRRVSPSPDAYLSNGYAAEVQERYRRPAAQASTDDEARPYTLMMGQVLYHSGKMSTQASGLINIEPNTGRIRMNPADVENSASQSSPPSDSHHAKVLSKRE